METNKNIEIVSNGIENKATQEITCQKCTSTFKITPQALGTVNEDRDGSYYNITCPVCHRLLFVDADVINPDMKNNGRNR